ncbi:hypothetical protein AB1Y20_005023 [Prymnesium parvum]|uniref:Uncharacterized protein n=1 Tax=Prymnesium parvum TaxID=97485 RepID=A0AB34J4R0_PRYPA|mmetsp:Transcript_1388/g.3585  ORF Transcript_1388/g.3585 Transcript_1388/m.3585 type:complete len:103 (+) Transcript_1388:648-956(+)
MMKSEPALLLLSVGRPHNAKGGAWDLHVRSVAEWYGLPLVSYRDAVWPVREEVKMQQLPHPGVFAHAYDNAAHPLWWTHQLIADVLAYAWSPSSRTERWKDL